MKMSTSSLLTIITLACVACGGSDADDDAAVPSSAEASPNAPAAAPDQQAVTDYREYRLTMPAVQRWYDAQSRIYRSIGENPELADEAEMFAEATDLDDMEAHFDGIPEWRAAVDEAGLDMREYVAILMALFSARSVDAAIQSGADRAQAIASGQVSQENLEFVEQNRSELDRQERELAELGESMD